MEIQRKSSWEGRDIPDLDAVGQYRDFATVKKKVEVLYYNGTLNVPYVLPPPPRKGSTVTRSPWSVIRIRISVGVFIVFHGKKYPVLVYPVIFLV